MLSCDDNCSSHDILLCCLIDPVFVAGASMVPNATLRSVRTGKQVALSIVFVSILLGVSL